MLCVLTPAHTLLTGLGSTHETDQLHSNDRVAPTLNWLPSIYQLSMARANSMVYWHARFRLHGNLVVN